MGQYKQGLDYFPFTIGLLKDRKLRKPKLKYGCIVNDIYLSLLELIYGDKGYYILYNEETKDDIIWEILENLQGKYCPTAETVEQVIGDLVACGLFSGDHFKSEILTSKRIQQTYYSATVERKAVEIDFGIWFLTKEEMEKLSTKSLIFAKFLNRSNEQDNRSNEQDNRSNEQESKEKKSSISIDIQKERKKELYKNNHQDEFSEMTDEELVEWGESSVDLSKEENQERLFAYCEELKKRKSSRKWKGKITLDFGRLKSYEEIMEEMGVPASLKTALNSFLQHCILNKHICTNDKLIDIICRLNEFHEDDEEEKVKCVEKAIRGGYYDIKEK